MATYYSTSGLTYDQYRQTQAFVEDIRLEISRGNAELAGLSREAAVTRAALIAEQAATRETMIEGFTAVGRLTAAGFETLDETTREGFATIHLDLRQNTEAVWAVSRTLQVGFARLETRLGALATSVDELISIAKTPEQTWAYEQYHVALEAFRRRLFDDALENLTRGLNGYGTHPGYRLEHRFHRLLGLIHRTAADAPIHDLAKAEEAYLTAVRYAEAVDKAEAASCLLLAAQLAYGRGDAAEAEQRSVRALGVHESGEGHFLLAKHMLANGKSVGAALDHLEQAIRDKPVFFLLAVAHPRDGSTNEFLEHEDKRPDPG